MILEFKDYEGQKVKVFYEGVTKTGKTVATFIGEEDDIKLERLLGASEPVCVDGVHIKGHIILFKDFIAELKNNNINMFKEDAGILVDMGIVSLDRISRGYDFIMKSVSQIILSSRCSGRKDTVISTPLKEYRLRIPMKLFNELTEECRRNYMITDLFINHAIEKALEDSLEVSEEIYSKLRAKLNNKLKENKSFEHNGCVINYHNYVMNDLNIRDIAVAFFGKDGKRIAQLKVDLLTIK